MSRGMNFANQPSNSSSSLREQRKKEYKGQKLPKQDLSVEDDIDPDSDNFQVRVQKSYQPNGKQAKPFINKKLIPKPPA